MTLLTLKQAERCHGDRRIFSGVSLRIGAKDRIGVIGDNGAGKTTLLRLLTGQDPPDQGERTARRGLRIAWSEQIPDLEPGTTVLQAARLSFRELEDMEARLRELEERMAEEPERRALQAEHERVHVAFEAGGGYRREQFVAQALMGLGLQPSDFERDVRTLSGGEKARVALARVMLLPAELLILDEPTNHLDLQGIAFLEDWLLSRRGAFVVVSHDRRFLDRVCGSILDVEWGRVTRYAGNFTAFRKQKELNLLTRLREVKKQEEFFARETAFIEKHMGGRRTAEARGRLKRLRRMKRLVTPGKKPRLRFSLGKKARGLEGQALIGAEGLSFAFEGKPPLFEGLDFRVFFGDRVGLVGPNGIGKTTLLRLMAGELRAGSGQLVCAKKLRIARFTQEMEDLPLSGSVLASLRARVPLWTDQECRDHLALFQFQEEVVDREVALLSGGERRRLCLARLLSEEHDLLLLDEPTNHLDISTSKALEEALTLYPGSLVLVSHDRWFLSKVATRIFELGREGIGVFEGGFGVYEEKAASRPGIDPGRKAGASAPRRRPERKPGPSTGRIQNPYAFAKLEERIMNLESELEGIHARLSSPDLWKEPQVMKELRARQKVLDAELGELYERWENWH